jgi:hypothetical protein
LQLPPGPVHVSPDTRQSALVQQVEVGMHWLLTEQSLPVGQPHEPPGDGQVWPGTVQSAFVQQVPVEMQALLAAHAVKFVGHAHVPPGVPHVSPVTVQLAVVQHVPVVMHVPLAVQGVLPVEHEHVPPGPEHVWPEIAQSTVVQHSVLGMHWLLAAHGLSPAAHWHTSPGLGQVSPWSVQSVVVQQAPIGMHTSPATHAFRLGGQLRTHVPLEQMWLVPHALPQEPQLFGSLPRFEQYGLVGAPPESTAPASTGAGPSVWASDAPASDAPPSGAPAPASAGMHSVSGGTHGKLHMPIEQLSPSGHTAPHEPQFFGSVPVLTHPPSHALVPVLQPPPSPVDDPSCPALSPAVPSRLESSGTPPSPSGDTLVLAPFAHAATSAPLMPTAARAAQSSRHRMRTSQQHTDPSQVPRLGALCVGL